MCYKYNNTHVRGYKCGFGILWLLILESQVYGSIPGASQAKFEEFMVGLSNPLRQQTADCFEQFFVSCWSYKRSGLRQKTRTDFKSSQSFCSHYYRVNVILKLQRRFVVLDGVP